jgi:hypothetical protein
VGRPGLDPGTLGIGPEHPTTRIVVQITWSAPSAPPWTSTEILSNLIPWLQKWLHNLGSGVTGVIQIRGSDGVVVEVKVGWTSGGER